MAAAVSDVGDKSSGEVNRGGNALAPPADVTAFSAAPDRASELHSPPVLSATYRHTRSSTVYTEGPSARIEDDVQARQPPRQLCGTPPLTSAESTSAVRAFTRSGSFSFLERSPAQWDSGASVSPRSDDDLSVPTASAATPSVPTAAAVMRSCEECIHGGSNFRGERAEGGVPEQDQMSNNDFHHLHATLSSSSAAATDLLTQSGSITPDRHAARFTSGVSWTDGTRHTRTSAPLTAEGSLTAAQGCESGDAARFLPTRVSRVSSITPPRHATERAAGTSGRAAESRSSVFQSGLFYSLEDDADQQTSVLDAPMTPQSYSNIVLSRGDSAHHSLMGSRHVATTADGPATLSLSASRRSLQARQRASSAAAAANATGAATEQEGGWAAPEITDLPLQEDNVEGMLTAMQRWTDATGANNSCGGSLGSRGTGHTPVAGSPGERVGIAGGSVTPYGTCRLLSSHVELCPSAVDPSCIPVTPVNLSTLPWAPSTDRDEAEEEEESASLDYGSRGSVSGAEDDGSSDASNSAAVIETDTLVRTRTAGVEGRSSYEVINEKYVLYDYELGKGSYSRVHLCYNVKDGCFYAAKVLDKVRLRHRQLSSDYGLFKMDQEINIMKQLQHRNIIGLREVIRDPNARFVFLIMELAAGREVLSMRDNGDVVPKADGRTDYPEATVRHLTRGVIRALRYAHYLGIAHRDVKPSNVLTTAQNTVKLCDFGVSVLVGELTMQLRREGSVAFLAPELLLSNEVYVSRFVSPAPLSLGGSKEKTTSESYPATMPIAAAETSTSRLTTEATQETCATAGRPEVDEWDFEAAVGGQPPLCAAPAGGVAAANLSQQPQQPQHYYSHHAVSPTHACLHTTVDLFKSDVFSLGVTVFTLLLGHLPWRASSASSQLAAVLDEADPFLRLYREAYGDDYTWPASVEAACAPLPTFGRGGGGTAGAPSAPASHLGSGVRVSREGGSGLERRVTTPLEVLTVATEGDDAPEGSGGRGSKGRRGAGPWWHNSLERRGLVTPPVPRLRGGGGAASPLPRSRSLEAANALAVLAEQKSTSPHPRDLRSSRPGYTPDGDAITNTTTESIATTGQPQLNQSGTMGSRGPPRVATGSATSPLVGLPSIPSGAEGTQHDTSGGETPASFWRSATENVATAAAVAAAGLSGGGTEVLSDPNVSNELPPALALHAGHGGSSGQDVAESRHEATVRAQLQQASAQREACSSTEAVPPNYQLPHWPSVAEGCHGSFSDRTTSGTAPALPRWVTTTAAYYDHTLENSSKREAAEAQKPTAGSSCSSSLHVMKEARSRRALVAGSDERCASDHSVLTMSTSDVAAVSAQPSDKGAMVLLEEREESVQASSQASSVSKEDCGMCRAVSGGDDSVSEGPVEGESWRMAGSPSSSVEEEDEIYEDLYMESNPCRPYTVAETRPLPARPGDVNSHAISAEAVDFVRACLVLDPAQRLSVFELFHHPWISKPSNHTEEVSRGRRHNRGVSAFKDGEQEFEEDEEEEDSNGGNLSPSYARTREERGSRYALQRSGHHASSAERSAASSTGDLFGAFNPHDDATPTRNRCSTAGDDVVDPVSGVNSACAASATDGASLAHPLTPAPHLDVSRFSGGVAREPTQPAAGASLTSADSATVLLSAESENTARGGTSSTLNATATYGSEAVLSPCEGLRRASPMERAAFVVPLCQSTGDLLEKLTARGGVGSGNVDASDTLHQQQQPSLLFGNTARRSGDTAIPPIHPQQQQLHRHIRQLSSTSSRLHHTRSPSADGGGSNGTALTSDMSGGYTIVTAPYHHARRTSRDSHLPNDGTSLPSPMLDNTADGLAFSGVSPSSPSFSVNSSPATPSGAPWRVVSGVLRSSSAAQALNRRGVGAAAAARTPSAAGKATTLTCHRTRGATTDAAAAFGRRPRAATTSDVEMFLWQASSQRSVFLLAAEQEEEEEESEEDSGGVARVCETGDLSPMTVSLQELITSVPSVSVTSGVNGGPRSSSLEEEPSATTQMTAAEPKMQLLQESALSSPMRRFLERISMRDQEQ